MKRTELKSLWENWGSTFLTVIAMIAVGVGSYLFGFLKGQTMQGESLVITQAHSANTLVCRDDCATLGKDQSQTLTEEGVGDLTLLSQKSVRDVESCLFVGSVNGTKFYPPDCKAVSRIKPENLTCFSSQEDATSKGYSRTKAC